LEDFNGVHLCLYALIELFPKGHFFGVGIGIGIEGRMKNDSDTDTDSDPDSNPVE